ncbi:Bax inhibitor-1/YccA family protein [bacterium]|nr:Bax inhibitor-1/YccA family protein [bacterium]
MKSGNPILNERRFQSAAVQFAGEERMTFNGALNKTGLLFLIVLLGASWSWSDVSWGAPAAGMSAKMIIGLIGGFIAAIATSFRPQWAPISAPIYAFLEGMFLGGISAFFEARYPGIVIPAVVLTFGIMVGMLVTYRAGLIPVTQKFRIGVIAATGGVFLFYMASMVMGMFGVSMPLLHGGGTLGIVLNLAIIGIATLNLVLDFDLIARLSSSGAPKQMEWYGAFALMVTLVWLYIEILRLLARTRE